MSENYKRLDAMQQKIEDLWKKKTRLKKKEQKAYLLTKRKLTWKDLLKNQVVKRRQEVLAGAG